MERKPARSQSTRH